MRKWIFLACLLLGMFAGCTITKTQIVVKHTLPSGVELAATIEGEM